MEVQDALRIHSKRVSLLFGECSFLETVSTYLKDSGSLLFVKKKISITGI